MEVWLNINSKYKVSNQGRIESLTRIDTINDVRYVKPYKRIRKGRILKPVLRSNGYYVCAIGSKQISVHRLVATAFIPNPGNKPQVNHKDLCKTNNKVENLEWVTAAENSQHAYDGGVYPPPRDLFAGEKSIAAKLNNHQVSDIKIKLLTGECLTDIAREYDVVVSTISWINSGHSYSDVGVSFNGSLVYAPNVKPKVRTVRRCNLDGSLPGKAYTVAEAVIKYGVKAHAIRKAARGDQVTAGGYSWKYEGNN